MVADPGFRRLALPHRDYPHESKRNLQSPALLRQRPQLQTPLTPT